MLQTLHVISDRSIGMHTGRRSVAMDARPSQQSASLVTAIKCLHTIMVQVPELVSNYIHERLEV